MGRIFGTDGIRGIANTEISCKLTMNVSRAAAMVIAERIGRQPVVLIGKDTRISSDMLEAAAAAGLCSVGADAVAVGVVPTPAISYFIAAGYADAGIMLSASHNPYEYNGIKIFGADGNKLTDAEEFEIEEIVLDKVKPYLFRWGWELGRMHRKEHLTDEYIAHIAGSIQGGLQGLRVAVDCSHGSAGATAQKLFEQLGAAATILNDTSNGVDINRDCGSTHIEKLAEIVKAGNFDAGVAFDGDADRCLCVDEQGGVVDGDKIMAILAAHMNQNGTLKDNTLVATVMSNLGLFRFAEQAGIHVRTTKVGDRYVLEEMKKFACNLGGEQSGHVILADYMGTGDGQLTAVHLLNVLKESGKAMSELAGVMTAYPQVMVNLRADGMMKSLLATDVGAEKIIADAKEALGADGRILVRASGTEPLIRVMIEGKDEKEITALAATVAEQLEERLSQNEDCKRLEGF